MSEKKGPSGMYPQVPTAPVGYPNYGYSANRGPLPSYEESQKFTYPPHPPPNYPPHPPPAYSQNHQYISPQVYMNAPTYPPLAGASHMQYNVAPQGTYLNAPPLQVTQQQYGVVYNTPQPNNGPQTVVFDSSARFKGKGAGSVNVPPPPPGYLPTPAQAAALRGQPVILQKKKKSFF